MSKKNQPADLGLLEEEELEEFPAEDWAGLDEDADVSEDTGMIQCGG